VQLDCTAYSHYSFCNSIANTALTWLQLITLGFRAVPDNELNHAIRSYRKNEEYGVWAKGCVASPQNGPNCVLSEGNPKGPGSATFERTRVHQIRLADTILDLLPESALVD
jgi:hypothetical protein